MGIITYYFGHELNYFSSLVSKVPGGLTEVWDWSLVTIALGAAAGREAWSCNAQDLATDPFLPVNSKILFSYERKEYILGNENIIFPSQLEKYNPFQINSITLEPVPEEKGRGSGGQ